MSNQLILWALFGVGFAIGWYAFELWKKHGTGPRRWGWIQSWGNKPKSNKIRFEDVFDDSFSEEFRKAKESRKIQVPEYFKTQKPDKSVFAVMEDDSVFKFNFDVSNWRKVRSKGYRFLPVSNPLGETAAHMQRAMPFADHYESTTVYRYAFRHKKGGRRG
jgi:hypothetical protein